MSNISPYADRYKNLVQNGNANTETSPTSHEDLNTSWEDILSGVSEGLGDEALDPIYPDTGYQSDADGTLGSEYDLGMEEFYTPSGENPSQPLSAKQQRALERIQKLEEELSRDFQNAQKDYNSLMEGELSPEEKQKQANEIESVLENIESDLEFLESKKAKLAEDGVSTEAPGSLEGFDLDLGDSSSLNSEAIENLKSDLANAQDEIDGEVAAVEAQEKAEAQALVQQREGKELKNATLDFLQYFNGGKERWYFTAKVWGKKHIKDYHEEVTAWTRSISKDIASAFESGDWSTVKTNVETIPSKDVDNVLGLIYVVMEKHHPELLKKMPSDVLEGFHDNILRGNSPEDSRIYYLDQKDDRGNFKDRSMIGAGFAALGGTFTAGMGVLNTSDRPRDDRFRPDMGHVGTSYADAAAGFLKQADINREVKASQGITYGPELDYEYDYSDPNTSEDVASQDGENTEVSDDEELYS